MNISEDKRQKKLLVYVYKYRKNVTILKTFIQIIAEKNIFCLKFTRVK